MIAVRISWQGLVRPLLAGLSATILALATPGLIQVGSTAAAQGTPTPPPIIDVTKVQPFVLTAANPAERAQAVRCLAQAVYFEAGYEPLDGQRAVAQVVLNRLRDPNFPASICGVVFQGKERRTGCQFSFVCDGSLRRRPPNVAEWSAALAVAQEALSGYVEPDVGAATHYHADYVDPYWASSLEEVTTVGAHTFYTWRGKAGEPAALTEDYGGGELGFVQATAMGSLRS